MRKKIFFCFALALIFFNCHTASKKNPVTDTDVATTFIRAVLDNDFATAKKYLLSDETNMQYFQSFQHQYQSKTPEELAKYKAADILINNLQNIKDTTFINYSNTYKKEVNYKLKLVRLNQQWLIDLKYTFLEN